jgi:hypothetical protein
VSALQLTTGRWGTPRWNDGSTLLRTGAAAWGTAEWIRRVLDRGLRLQSSLHSKGRLAEGSLVSTGHRVVIHGIKGEPGSVVPATWVI